VRSAYGLAAASPTNSSSICIEQALTRVAETTMSVVPSTALTQATHAIESSIKLVLLPTRDPTSEDATRKLQRLEAFAKKFASSLALLTAQCPVTELEVQEDIVALNEELEEKEQLLTQTRAEIKDWIAELKAPINTDVELDLDLLTSL